MKWFFQSGYSDKIWNEMKADGKYFLYNYLVYNLLQIEQAQRMCP